MAVSNEATIERLFTGVWDGTNPSTADELVHEDYVIHDREAAASVRGPELYKALAAATRDIFPDAEFTIDDTIVDGDRVAVRWTMVGTHEGAADGVEPTGERVTMDAIEIDRFEDGRLRETWTRSDQLGLLDQLGALPDDSQ